MQEREEVKEGEGIAGRAKNRTNTLPEHLAAISPHAPVRLLPPPSLLSHSPTVNLDVRGSSVNLGEGVIENDNSSPLSLSMAPSVWKMTVPGGESSEMDISTSFSTGGLLFWITSMLS